MRIRLCATRGSHHFPISVNASAPPASPRLRCSRPRILARPISPNARPMACRSRPTSVPASGRSAPLHGNNKFPQLPAGSTADPPGNTGELFLPTGAQVYVYKSAAPEGMCIALPRSSNPGGGSSNIIGLDGVICLGKTTSKVCFWDNQEPDGPGAPGPARAVSGRDGDPDHRNLPVARICSAVPAACARAAMPARTPTSCIPERR